MGENGGVKRTVRVTRALAALLVTYSEETLLDLCGHEENREKEKAEVKNRVRVGVRVTESKTEERMSGWGDVVDWKHSKEKTEGKACGE